MQHRVKSTVLLILIASIALSLFILGQPDQAKLLAQKVLDAATLSPSDRKLESSQPKGTDNSHEVPGVGDSRVPDGQDQDVTITDAGATAESSDLQTTLSEGVQKYIDAILDPADTSFDRLHCPPDLGIRYEALRKPSANGKPKYFIALDLYKAEPILPRLLGSLVQVIKYLGPSNCAVSIIEGRSDDLTYPILKALQTVFRTMEMSYHLSQNPINPWGGNGIDRIGALAELRNMALEPLISNPSAFASNPVVLFVNDIAVCPSDMLELLYQHVLQSAHQTCAMDWIHNGDAFYDVWVSRTINSGNIFFEIPQDADWKYKDSMFWDDPSTKKKFDSVQPFEVYACWGGMVTIDPQPFIAREIRFRNSAEGECYMGEPTLLGKDLWRNGLGRIATVPSVNVGYNDAETKQIKKRRGYVGDHVDLSRAAEDTQTEMIEWKSGPPPMVKCLPKWEEVSWVAPI